MQTDTMLRCTTANLLEVIWPLVKANVPVCLHGKSGIGKSDLSRILRDMLEREYGMTILHDYRVSGMDTADATGNPISDPVKLVTLWTRPAPIPEEDNNMHLMVLDEVGHVDIRLQHAIVYQLVRDRSLNGHPLPKQNRVILIMNSEEANGMDNELVAPLANRCAHVYVDVSVSGWINHESAKGHDPAFLSFFELKGDLLHKFDAKSYAWPSPRTVEMLADVYRDNPGDMEIFSNAATALCGKGFAAEIVEYMKTRGNLPRLAAIVADPDNTPVPTELHHQMLVARAIGQKATLGDSARFAIYLKRLPADLASLAAILAIGRDARTEKEFGKFRLRA